jgi:hypothetical protein
METTHPRTDATATSISTGISDVLSTSELAAYLRVSVQTLYDLRC